MRTYLTASKEYCTMQKHQNAPLFKTVFDCADPSDARIQISAIGFYRLFLNGEELTKGVLAPYISNPDDLVYYDEYPVALKERDNVLCVLLGNGFGNAMDNNIWQFEQAPFRAAPKLYLSLCAGGREIVSTARGFRVAPSPITFDDLRCGEHYDARLEDDSLVSPTFGDRFTEPLIAEPPKGEYRKCEAHPVRITGTIGVKRIIRSEKGWLYDFGEVNSGVATIRITAHEGQEVAMTFVEMISHNEPDQSNMMFDGGRSVEGYVQHDRLICREGRQEYTPSFTYHGFQYVYVEGITPEQATEDLLTVQVIRSDFPGRASFLCGDPIVNKITDASLRSATSNFVYFITDCPQREKNGWTSEGQVTAEYALYYYDCAASLREWMRNIRKAQRADGAIPGIIPTAGWGFGKWHGPQWDKILTEIPWLLYRFTGDVEVVRENLDAIGRYLGYLKGKINEDGLIDYGLCDWCEMGGNGDSDTSTPTEISDSLIILDFLRKARELFRIAGDTRFDAEIRQLDDGFRAAFRKKYVRGAFVTCETQTAQALALELGVFEESERKAAFDGLVELVHRADDHLRSGVMGYRHVLRMLAQSGHADLAYRAITTPTHPSYGNIILQGATGMWEKFTEYYETDEGIRQKDGWIRNYSLNHSVFGGVTAWFMEYLAGIRVTAHDTVRIAPCLIREPGDIRASFENEGRRVEVRIEEAGGQFKISVENHGFCCTLSAAGRETVCPEGTTVVYR